MADSYPLLKGLKEPLYLNKGNISPSLVKEIQTLLREGKYYLGEINGYLDDRLFAAFKEFKKKSYLEYPDVLGKSTISALLEIVGEAEHPIPEDAKFQVALSSKGKVIKLPGGEVVYCDQPIKGCKNFLWGEVTKNGTRIPLNTEIVGRIINTAYYLEIVRTIFDDRPITINSWYRPPNVNTAVGGVSNSRHLLGDAVDFIIEGMPPLEVYRRLNNWHGARGGLGQSSQFTHLDLRGYYARFSYG